MKKIISLSLICLLAVGLFSACGCAKKDSAVGSAEPSQTAETTESAVSENDSAVQSTPDDGQNEITAELPAVSDNKTVVTEENAPKVFMIQNAESNTDKLTYHLENCKMLEGKEAIAVSWEYIKTVGFWQCPECNPPRYEDYTNAQ